MKKNKYRIFRGTIWEHIGDNLHENMKDIGLIFEKTDGCDSTVFRKDLAMSLENPFCNTVKNKKVPSKIDFRGRIGYDGFKN